MTSVIINKSEKNFSYSLIESEDYMKKKMTKINV